VVAIEALAAAQGLDLRGMPPGPGTGAAHAAVRELSPRLEEDRSLSADIEATRDLVASGSLLEQVEREVKSLD
jgi:histidine ammonia-lyase